MKNVQRSSLWSSYCVKEPKACVGWVDDYFGDCLCNTRDKISFVCGVVSLISWGIAEIPQIITNFRTKSSHGVSLLFLFTWILGDVFNLIGCLLEPATVTTNPVYTALLYTLSTVVLVLQSLYYDHVYSWSKTRKADVKPLMDNAKKPLQIDGQIYDDKDSDELSIPIPRGVGKDLYFTSARSMAGSKTPPNRSYLWPARSGPPALGLVNDSSSDDEADHRPCVAYKKFEARPRSFSCSVSYGTFLATSLNLPKSTLAFVEVYVAKSGRKLLQEGGGSENYVVGQWLGWMMAAIYMGGRLPQIFLNIKRGSVEGLNPLMFIFALVANVTYVGSIVIRSMEWDKLKANLPWLLDAIVCVGLDLFIILQYIYYKYYIGKRDSGGRSANDDDYYFESH